MGFINQFNVERIIRDYNINNFFETGTWKGDAVAYALQFPFEKIISAEIVPTIADEAKFRFKKETRVTILEAYSTMALSKELPFLKGNCLFWLDAHFPGADAGLDRYDAVMDEDIRLPLEKELAIIHEFRKNFNDVLIIDDMRLYEDGPYENGNSPADTLPRKNRNLDFINWLFGRTHIAMKTYRNEGYILLFPKAANRLTKSFLDDLFLKDYFY
jgi:hypothetical protein